MLLLAVFVQFNLYVVFAKVRFLYEFPDDADN